MDVFTPGASKAAGSSTQVSAQIAKILEITRDALEVIQKKHEKELAAKHKKDKKWAAKYRKMHLADNVSDTPEPSPPPPAPELPPPAPPVQPHTQSEDHPVNPLKAVAAGLTTGVTHVAQGVGAVASGVTTGVTTIATNIGSGIGTGVTTIASGVSSLASTVAHLGDLEHAKPQQPAPATSPQPDANTPVANHNHHHLTHEPDQIPLFIIDGFTPDNKGR
jgi:hypothetical protein